MFTSVEVTVFFAFVFALIELAGPLAGERMNSGTPWHAHHIAEHYSLFALIALGEGVVGTVEAFSAVAEAQNWSVDPALICIAGVGLTFGMWWVYYLLPSAEILKSHRNRAFVGGCGQIMMVIAIVATGAGMHVAA